MRGMPPPSKRARSIRIGRAASGYDARVTWCVYILRCGDGSLYTGSTNDLARRLKLHGTGKGARYTKGRGPLVVVYCEPCEGRSDALRREIAIKRLGLTTKRALCATLRRH
jgi:predicted GIY-YIG superfamily endonuclease